MSSTGIRHNTIKALGKLVFGKANKANTSLAEFSSPVATIDTKYGPMLLTCNNRLLLWRAETFFDKEPDTLEWIDSFGPNETLFDVGANIGLYTLYAGKKGTRVLAFEPESSNYSLLNRNIYLNGLSEKVTSFNLAISDDESIGHLNLSSVTSGSALHSFGTTTDLHGKEFAPVFKQGVASFSIDQFVAKSSLGFPNHLKIDVDGLEAKIIKGAEKTLRDPRLKSVLIELNTDLPDDVNVIEVLKAAGFEVARKYIAPMFEGSAYKNIFNFTFTRKN